MIMIPLLTNFQPIRSFPGDVTFSQLGSASVAPLTTEVRALTATSTEDWQREQNTCSTTKLARRKRSASAQSCFPTRVHKRFPN